MAKPVNDPVFPPTYTLLAATLARRQQRLRPYPFSGLSTTSMCESDCIVVPLCASSSETSGRGGPPTPEEAEDDAGCRPWRDRS